MGSFGDLVNLQNIKKDTIIMIWHCDSWDKAYKRKNKNDPDNGKIRKLFMTCQHSPMVQKYSGGELVI